MHEWKGLHEFSIMISKIFCFIKKKCSTVSAVMFYKQFLAYTLHIDCCYHSIHKHSSRSQHAPIWYRGYIVVPSRADIYFCCLWADLQGWPEADTTGHREGAHHLPGGQVCDGTHRWDTDPLLLPQVNLRCFYLLVSALYRFIAHILLVKVCCYRYRLEPDLTARQVPGTAKSVHIYRHMPCSALLINFQLWFTAVMIHIQLWKFMHWMN